MRRDIALLVLIGIALAIFTANNSHAAATITPSNGVFCVGSSVGLSGGGGADPPSDPCGCDGNWLGPTSSNAWSGDVTGASGTSANLDTSTTGGKSATFTVTSTWTCSTNATPMTFTTNSSASGSYTVVNVDISPASTNALINGCQDPNRSVAFSLTNSYNPGGVTWSITPSGLTGGATISGGTVTIGDVVTNYTIKATSNDNTNCFDTASLTLDRDCICTNHIINATAIPVGAYPGCDLDDSWGPDSVFEDSCGNELQLECSGAPTAGVKYTYNDDIIGYCPYNPSEWNAWYWLCECGHVIMRAQFWVENGDSDPPGLACGKYETWECGVEDVDQSCYCTVLGVTTDRPCTPAD